MKNLICLVLVLFSTNVFAASGSGNVSSVVSAGGMGQIPGSITVPVSALGTPATTPITLHATFNGTANNVAPLYKNGLVYQVGGTTKFYVTQVCYEGTATSSPFQLLHDTVAFAQNATTASLTAPKYMNGASALFSYYVFAANTPYCKSEFYRFPSSSFPGIQERDAATTMMISVYGFEI